MFDLRFLISKTLLLCLGSAAMAQLSNLDKSMLIDGLAKEGMSELLLHLVETEPSEDPVEDAQIRIAQHRVRFRALAGKAAAAKDPDEARRLAAESRAAFDQMLAGQRRIIADHRDHEQRPIWQTDLAEALLLDWLQGLQEHASEFYAFGVVSETQRTAISLAAVEALESTTEADLRFFELRGLLSRDTARHRQLVNFGIWTRMFDEYWAKRTAFYLAQSAFLVAQLSDDDPYFAQLGEPGKRKLPQQRDDAASERSRLLGVAAAKLRPFVDDLGDAAGIRFAAMVLLGRVMSGQGKSAEAIETLWDPVIAAQQGDFFHLLAQLAKAHAVGADKPRRGLELLSVLGQHAQVKSNPLLRLLITDATYQMLNAAAVDGDAAAHVYGPYLELISDPDLAPPVRSYLKQQIYRRWSDSVRDDVEVETLPPAVRMAIGEIASQEGQNLSIEANETDDESVRELARERLAQSIQVNQTLLAEDIPRAVSATARYHLALSRYWMEPNDGANLLDVCALLMEVAKDKQMRAEPLGEHAVTIGIDLLRRLREATPAPAGAQEAYERGVAVLFGDYPTSAAADNERVYYGYEVQQTGGDFPGAIATYNRVPEHYDTFFEGQREKLFCLQALALAAESQGDATARSKALAAVEDVTSKARSAMNDSDPERAHSAQGAVAAGRVVLANLAHAAGDVAQALAHLDGFADEFGSHLALSLEAMTRRILILIDAERFDEASAAAKKMMGVYPDDAAAIVDRVLSDLEEQAQKRRSSATVEPVAERKQEMLEQARGLSSTALLLSNVLVEWARTQGMDEQQMLPFELILVRASRQAGNPDDAMKVVSPIFARFPDDANVINEYADVMYQYGYAQYDAGDVEAARQTLILAAEQYDRLIIGLSDQSPTVWNAWLRRLSINEKLDTYTEDIGLRVRQLRLTDPDLGGPAFKAELEKLEKRHAP